MVAERLPAMCGSDTFTTVVSSTSIKVLVITEIAIIHGLMWRVSSAGAAISDGARLLENAHRAPDGERRRFIAASSAYHHVIQVWITPLCLKVMVDVSSPQAIHLLNTLTSSLVFVTTLA